MAFVDDTLSNKTGNTTYLFVNKESDTIWVTVEVHTKLS